MIRIIRVLYIFLFLNCSSNVFIRNLLSLISCFAYTIQLIKKYRAYIWPKKEIIFKEGKQFKVFTGRDLMTLSKKKIVWGFRKLGPRELWSYQMLIIQYIIIELNPHCLDPSFIFLFRNLGKVQVKVIFWSIRFWRGCEWILLSKTKIYYYLSIKKQMF